MCKCQYHLNSKHNQSIFSLTGVLLNDKHKPGSTKIFIGKLKLPIKKKKKKKPLASMLGKYSTDLQELCYRYL